MNVSEILINSLSPDPSLREQATATLERAASENYILYLELLLNEVANESTDVYVRSAAGLAIKNTLFSKDAERRNAQAYRWISLEPTKKSPIKEKILSLLGSKDNRIGTVSAQIVQAIAYIELPRGEWNELMGLLLKNLSDSTSSIQLQKATLETIGFICEETSADVLVSNSTAILSGILNGLQMEHEVLKITAANSFLNCLEFVRDAFEDDHKRDFIMHTIGNAACSSTEKVTVVVLECMIKILQLYYDKMKPYMEQGLFPLTVRFLNSENEDIVLQAIEFWSTVCEIEYNLMGIEEDESEEQCFFFASMSLPFILPILLKLLVKKGDDDDEDDDEWNVSMASSTCLSLWAECTRDEILNSTELTTFIANNIANHDWHYKEASVMAIGCVVVGPSLEALNPIISTYLSPIRQLILDNSSSVRDTSAWTLGRIVENLLPTVNSNEVPATVDAFVDGLKLSPRTACHCAWGLSHVARHFQLDTHETLSPTDHFPVYFQLASRFDLIVSALFTAINRPDSGQTNLKAVAYESLISQIANCSNSSLGTVENVCISIIDQLAVYCESNSKLKPEEQISMEISDTQAHLCALLQAIIRRLGLRVKPHSDRIMRTFMIFLSSYSTTASFVFEDIFLAIGSLLSVLGDEFIYYMQAFYPFLIQILSSHSEVQLCTIALGLVGDLSRTLNRSISPYAEGLLNSLYSLLRIPSLNQSIIPYVVTCFGDLALAMEKDFEPFFAPILNVLAEVSNRTNTARQHDDWSELINEIRISVLEALTCIVQGMKSGGIAQLFEPSVSSILDLIYAVQSDPITSHDTIKAAIALLGDIADSLGDSVRNAYRAHNWIAAFVNRYQSDKKCSSSLRKTANWTHSIISQVMRGD